MLIEVYEVYKRDSQYSILFESEEKFKELIDTPIFNNFEYDLCSKSKVDVSDEDLKNLKEKGYSL